MYRQKSFYLKPGEYNKKWYVIDAKDAIVGRLATEVASILRGKKNPQYTPNTDAGDCVVIINAEKIRFTGNKLDKKVYYKHTGYIGGLKERTVKEQLDKHPELVVYNAVKGMLPKNSLGRKQLKKLKVVVGEEHGFEAQKPEVYNL